MTLNKANLITIKDPKSPISESYRTLRTNIQFSSFDKKIDTVFVTSATPGEGKSTTSSNLAAVMAQNGCKTILVDCDLRKPSVHKKFGISNLKGLTDLLIQSGKIENIIQKSDLENLHILTSGSKPPNPSELLSSNKMREFIKMCKNYYDFVVLDTPPVGVVTDAQLISQYCDGAVLVVASGEAERETVKKSAELIKKVGGKILGVVLNKVDTKTQRGYHYYDYYDDVEHSGSKRKKR
ncbi:CpsD/CapB family tyrosine-protein kinase [Clostridium oceanicum]|uniref:non-specific protein-tyrosine kinase n=1 Tax=Clostridium oceanicum TaxID=1543 RepID=A0ABP3V1W4_9CLOT